MCLTRTDLLLLDVSATPVPVTFSVYATFSHGLQLALASRLTISRHFLLLLSILLGLFYRGGLFFLDLLFVRDALGFGCLLVESG